MINFLQLHLIQFLNWWLDLIGKLFMIEHHVTDEVFQKLVKLLSDLLFIRR